jgi:hypothetical protein
MFKRVKTVHSGEKTYQYVQIVENRRENGRVRQRVVATLGQLDQLVESGQLERLVKGLATLCPTVQLLEAGKAGTLAVLSDRCWGPVLVFQRLWKDLGLDTLLTRLAGPHRFGFELERCAFAIVLQRLLAPGSDLAGSKWIDTMEAHGFEKLRLQHFYRTIGQLWKWKVSIEQHLFRRGLDLFNSELDLVFFDTTSTYFEGMTWEGWAKRGYSRDHRYDHLQLVLGVVMRRDGVPITLEIWPGNTADVSTLKTVIERLKQRFNITRVVLVCDRGMTSKRNLNDLEAAGYEYIVGMRMRASLEVRESVLRRAGRYRVIEHEKLELKEVWVEDRRYIICRNPERALKDQRDREAILEALRNNGSGLGKVVPNRGYRRFLKAAPGAIAIDEAKVRDDERYDGKYVLRTNTTLPAADVAESYKHLTWIERLWRELKDVVEVRPIYHHKKKNNVCGHIFASFLALYLSAFLRRRLASIARNDSVDTDCTDARDPARLPVPWNDLMRDLSGLRALRVRLGNDTFLMRNELKGHAHLAFRAAQLRPPPVAQLLDPAPPAP